MAGDRHSRHSKRFQSAYERLRREQPHLSHKELWHQTERAVMSGTDLLGEALSLQATQDRIAARTEELVATEGLKRNEAWRQAETESGVVSVAGSRFDPRLLLLLFGGFASVWVGFQGVHLIRGSDNPAEPLFLWFVAEFNPDEFLAGLSAATALPAVLLFAVGVFLGASSRAWHVRARVTALSLWVAGISLGVFFLGAFYIDAEAVGVAEGVWLEQGGAGIVLLSFAAAFFGMLLGLVGLMFGTGLRLTRRLASPDVENV